MDTNAAEPREDTPIKHRTIPAARSVTLRLRAR